ncbi:MAG: PAS domain S-box protein [Bacteroidales bacterium]|nr:PAS domain S-box protein [Bacteroidales bacterium]
MNTKIANFFQKIYSLFNESVLVVNHACEIVYSNTSFNSFVININQSDNFQFYDFGVNFINIEKFFIGKEILNFLSKNEIKCEKISCSYKQKQLSEYILSVINDVVFENNQYFVLIFNQNIDKIDPLSNFSLNEKRYKLVFENSPIGFFQFNIDGVISDCNNEFVKIIGSTKQDLIGFDILHQVTNIGIKNAVKNATQGEIGTYEGKYISVTGKKETYIKAMFAPVYSENKIFDLGIAIIEDITKQKINELEIIQSQNKFQAIFQNASDSIIIGDSSGVIISSNHAFTQLSNYQTEEIKGTHIKNFFSNNCLEKKPLNFAELNKGNTIITDRWLIKKSGEKVHIEMNSKKINEINYISIIRDLTERDIDQQKIKESQERNNALFEVFPDIIFILNDQNEIIDYNTHKLDSFLVPPEEFVSKKYYQYLPENVAEITKINIEKLKQTGEIQTYEYQIHKKNIIETYEAKLVKMGEDKILSVVRDITNRKKIEQQSIILSQVVKLSSNSIFVTNLEGIFEYVNPAFEKNTGYKFEEIKNKTPRILKSDHHDSSFYKNLWSTILKGRTWTGEFLNQTKDGRCFWDKSVISPIVTENGQITNFFAINENITEKKKMLEDLTEAKEIAERSDRLKTSFLQNMSHEIRTPLNGILGFAGLISEEETEIATIKEYSSIIYDSGTRLLNIINNLIEISQIEAGNVKSSTIQFSLNQTLIEIYNSFVVDAEVKVLDFKYQFAFSDNNSFVVTDKAILIQIFIHLIDNAIKYTKFGAIKFGYEYENNEFLFFVKDTGIGISEDQKSIIFDSFYKADDISTVGIQGSGVGLSIVKSLVGLLNGEIWVDSMPQKGSVFYFKFKNIISVENVLAITSQNYIKPASKIILIAEDDKTSFAYLESILKKEFTEILHAKNGQQAVDFVKHRNDIDLILMDIRMPVLNGLEATKQIKIINPKIPIIAQTAYAFSTDQKDVFDAGCDSYITKPVKKDELLDSIYKFLKQ